MAARLCDVFIAVNMSKAAVEANFEAIRQQAGWKAEYAQFQGMRMGVQSLDDWLGYVLHASPLLPAVASGAQTVHERLRN